MNRIALSIASLFSSLIVLGTFQQANADDRVWRTSSSLIEPTRYPPDFKHFDYVNPDAPKGGTLNKTAVGTFDSFNPYIVKGNPPNGMTSFGGPIWDTMMQQSLDEAGTSHPLIAEAFTYPDDYSSATYRLDERARWHDGTPITVEDVKWSMETLKKDSPLFNRYFANVKEVRIDSDRELTFLFDQKNNRELPHIIGDLPVLPQKWFEGTDANGKKRSFSETTLERPLGNGPYKFGKFKAGSLLEYDLVEDYWAKDLPTNKGRFNFGKIVYRFFRDGNATWEAFKKGGFDDYRTENRAQKWATEYNFDAVKRGDVRKVEFEATSAYITNMIYMNTQRPKFADRRVRKALAWAMNFEDMNKNLFYDLYDRSTSYFGGTELSASGLPTGRELEILEEYRGKIPDELFTQPYEMPAYKDRRDERKHLRTALGLLKEAGWERKGTKLVNSKSGEQFKLEILSFNSTSERVYAPWLNSLKKLGIDASFRVIDQAQYVQRAQNFEYDVMTRPTLQSTSPGNEQREYWSSKAADQPGSRNMARIKNPVIDELTERVIFAKDREELIVLTKALERILQFEYYSVPGWYSSKDWFGVWKKVVIPPKQPAYYGYDPRSWWIDPKLAEAN